jgi:hypothetical protein
LTCCHHCRSGQGAERCGEMRTAARGPGRCGGGVAARRPGNPGVTHPGTRLPPHRAHPPLAFPSPPFARQAAGTRSLSDLPYRPAVRAGRVPGWGLRWCSRPPSMPARGALARCRSLLCVASACGPGGWEVVLHEAFPPAGMRTRACGRALTSRNRTHARPREPMPCRASQVWARFSVECQLSWLSQRCARWVRAAQHARLRAQRTVQCLHGWEASKGHAHFL